MAEIILHHYDTSPFSEKVRLRRVEAVAWRSVIPTIMPKPDLTPLTGGYRRTPVLQIGADIYCDTQIILRELKRAPEPPLMPDGQEGDAQALASGSTQHVLVSRRHRDGVTAISCLRPSKGPQRILRRPVDPAGLKAADRGAGPALRAGCAGRGVLAQGPARPAGRPAEPRRLRALQSRVVPAGAHGCGASPSPLDRLPRIVAWSERMKAIGSGKPAEMTAVEALDVAKAATPEAAKVDEGDPSGLKAGQKVSVVPVDTGKVPVSGALVGLTADRVSIIRSDRASATSSSTSRAPATSSR